MTKLHSVRVIVHYTVKPETAAENVRLIKSMCDEFNDQQYEGLRYAAYKSEDGVTFYHFAFVLGDNEPLLNSEGFKAFKLDIAARYYDIAKPTLVLEVGSYEFHTSNASLSGRGQ